MRVSFAGHEYALHATDAADCATTTPPSCHAVKNVRGMYPLCQISHPPATTCANPLTEPQLPMACARVSKR